MTKETGRGVRLTKRTIDAAEPGAARFIVWDCDLKGFGLRVEPKPSGAKTFVVRYRVGGGRRGTLRQFKIGRYGKLTPDEARDAAEKVLAQVELGQDPQAMRAAARETLRVSELCDLYLAEGVATKKASTLALDKIRIAGHIKPLIGNRRITEVGSADIDALMSEIASGKVKARKRPQSDDDASPRAEPSDGTLPPGSRVRGGPGAASRTVGLLSGIFKFAVARKLCSENPAKGVARFKDRKRERFLSPAELGKLGDALTAAENEGANLHHVAIIRLLALTGARKNEIAQLCWAEIDYERGMLRLADSKTGPKTVRLGAAAQELLSKTRRTSSPYVFPDPRDIKLPIRNLDWAWVGIRKRAGLEDVRIHDLRHSFASVGLAGGSGLHLIGKLLGHANVATTNRYAHLSDDPLQDAADKISREVSAALSGATGAQVVRARGGDR